MEISTAEDIEAEERVDELVGVFKLVGRLMLTEGSCYKQELLKLVREQMEEEKLCRRSMPSRWSFTETVSQ